MKRHAALLLLIAAAPTLAQTAYRWVDDKGHVQYSDQPPPSAVSQYDQRNISANQSGSTQQPYVTRQAAGKYPVTLYVSKDCGKACEDGRALLKKRAIPFTESRIESAEDVAAYKTRVGAEPFVPTLLVGREKETGFAAPAWDSLLDKAGYPPARR